MQLRSVALAQVGQPLIVAGQCRRASDISPNESATSSGQAELGLRLSPARPMAERPARLTTGTPHPQRIRRWSYRH